jgi:hypothetical protein
MTAVEGSGAQLGFYEADAILPAAGAWAVTIWSLATRAAVRRASHFLCCRPNLV